MTDPVAAPARFPVREVSNVDLAFPTSVREFLPPYADIPEEFKQWGSQRWENRLVKDRFFVGVTDLALVPREGIDPEKAWRHVSYVLGSWEPKHEHKEAGCAFLLSQWFESATWKPRDPKAAK